MSEDECSPFYGWRDAMRERIIGSRATLIESAEGRSVPLESRQAAQDAIRQRDTLFATSAQGADSDERYTPQWIFDGLGLEFDVDPASPGYGAGDCVPAAVKHTIAHDGLSQPWRGRVWLNPPFSNATPWARKFVEHGHGIFLGPVANAAWCIELMQAADVVWFMRDFPFTHPTHAGKRSSMPLFMAAIGPEERRAVIRLGMSGRHDGVLFDHFA